MELFETIIVMMFGATLLSVLAKRINVPYPTLLALAGAIVTFIPGTPRIDLPPEVILALFVAPVLLDAAFDMSLRDLRRNWRPVTSLVVIAVGLTTVLVAATAHWLMPDLPWGAAVALGALLAPPDAVAALAVMAQVNPPHQIRKVLEGESLLNDASALLIYKLAVMSVVAGNFSLSSAMPTFLLVVVGSALAGWLLNFIMRPIQGISDEPATVVLLQFLSTFGIWILADKLGLSPVVTIVVFAVIASRSVSRQGVRQSAGSQAALRLPTYAVWETATFILNVLAFTLIGLQLAPIRANVPTPEQGKMLLGSLLILLVVILARLVWAALYMLYERSSLTGKERYQPLSKRGELAIGWAGMRGIVTLAAALALPENFPERDFILLTAFVVVLGTLLIQGLTLRPLLVWLNLPKDDLVENEVRLARAATLKAALYALKDETSPEADMLRAEYKSGPTFARTGNDLTELPRNALRRETLTYSRLALDKLRNAGTIGDDAYWQVQGELDVFEVASGPRE